MFIDKNRIQLSKILFKFPFKTNLKLFLHEQLKMKMINQTKKLVEN